MVFRWPANTAVPCCRLLKFVTVLSVLTVLLISCSLPLSLWGLVLHFGTSEILLSYHPAWWALFPTNISISQVGVFTAAVRLGLFQAELIICSPARWGACSQHPMATRRAEALFWRCVCSAFPPQIPYYCFSSWWSVFKAATGRCN